MQLLKHIHHLYSSLTAICLPCILLTAVSLWEPGGGIAGRQVHPTPKWTEGSTYNLRQIVETQGAGAVVTSSRSPVGRRGLSVLEPL